VSKVLYLFLCAFPLIAFSSECPEVRLDKTSLKNVPMLDQDGSGLCWAYTASTLIDAYRFSHGDTSSFVSSPIAIASQAVNGHNDNGFGYVSSAISAVNGPGGKLCDHFQISKKFRSTDFFLGQDFWPSKGLDENEFHCLPLAALLNFKDQVMVASLQNLSLRSIRKDIESLCSKEFELKVSLPAPKTLLVSKLPDKKAVGAHLKSLLSKKSPQPIAIAYCEDVLRDKSVKSVVNGIRRDCKNKHLSSVVGSRKSAQGGCEFLVRNSYGKSCKPYAWECTKGQVWVPESALTSNIEGMTWLE
jgi:hypothetical protein